MHAAIGEVVVVDFENDNVLVYNYELRYPMKADNGAYCGFEKDVDMNQDVECNIAETEADTYDQYTVAELELPDKDGMKRMKRVLQRLRDADVNTDCIGKYRAWADHYKYVIGFCDGSTSKLIVNIIAENMLSQVDSEGRHFQLFKEICDHGSYRSAIPKRFGLTVYKNVSRTPERNTAGRKLPV